MITTRVGGASRWGCSMKWRSQACANATSAGCRLLRPSITRMSKSQSTAAETADWRTARSRRDSLSTVSG